MIYTFYHAHIFLNINSLLSSITLDTLKNYYTFVYHIKNDSQLLHFSGMNFPYGEHIVYTDCQPILTFILRPFPFLHNYLAGILHTLMYLSFIISPLLIHSVFLRLKVPAFHAFFFSLGIALLAPQYLKINAGHFGLAYGCIIPLAMLLLLQFMQEGRFNTLIKLCVYTILLFFLHPYLGFAVSVFSTIALVLFTLPRLRSGLLKHLLLAFFPGLVPVIIFKVFMLITDTHAERPTEPYGLNVMVENITSLISPEFGPFKDLFKTHLPERSFHFEGHSYLGMSTLVLLMAMIPAFLIARKKPPLPSAVLLLSSLALLFLAFGGHTVLAGLTGFRSEALNQFRASCRFAYFFYYALPVFFVAYIFGNPDWMSRSRVRAALKALTLLLFGLSLLEAHYFFKKDQEVFWKSRNIFNEHALNAEEKTMIREIRQKAYQAILPLPMFHGGSEVYERTGSNNSYLPSMIYSYHTASPIMSVLMSRTSLAETRNVIELLNTYKSSRSALSMLSNQPLLAILTKDPLLPDEARLSQRIRYFRTSDSLSFGSFTKEDLSAAITDEKQVSLKTGTDSLHKNEIIYLSSATHKPFVRASLSDYETILALQPNSLKPGKYILSLHYHFTDKTYKGVAANLIVTRTENNKLEWDYNMPLRVFSGFYGGFNVFEQNILLKPDSKYEFLIKGLSDKTYHISHFMLRPEGTTVLDTVGGAPSINNFPAW